MGNCYNVPERLFLLGDKELLSHEGTTQWDSFAMAVYGIALTPPLKYLTTCYPERDPVIPFLFNLFINDLFLKEQIYVILLMTIQYIGVIVF